MPHGVIVQHMPASAAAVFNALHDYERRLEWDTLLSEAYLCNAAHAGVGASSVCRGKSRLGGFALKTEYISFHPGESAAVKMVNRPPFFDTFAATIRHRPVSEETSVVEYTYTFTSRPRSLSVIMDPVMNWAFARETRRRLRSLAAYVCKPGEHTIG